MEPVGLLLVEETRGGIGIRTDAGQCGWGVDLSGAIRDMEATAAGQVFLDTAENLLVSPEAARWLPELADRLHASCQLCLAEGVTDPGAATAYLAVHESEVTLGDWKKGSVVLPILYQIEERMYLAKP